MSKPASSFSKVQNQHLRFTRSVKLTERPVVQITPSPAPSRVSARTRVMMVLTTLILSGMWLALGHQMAHGEGPVTRAPVLISFQTPALHTALKPNPYLAPQEKLAWCAPSVLAPNPYVQTSKPSRQRSQMTKVVRPPKKGMKELVEFQKVSRLKPNPYQVALRHK